MNNANKLSVFRIILVPVIVLVYYFGNFSNIILWGGFEIPQAYVILFCLFVLASFTDFLDGYLARKHHMITSFGKFIDPIADKLLVNSLLIILALENRMPLFLVLIMIWRDLLVDGMRMMAAEKQIVVAAQIWGKVKTVIQMACIGLMLLMDYPFFALPFSISLVLAYLATIVSAYSGILYFYSLKDIIMESK